MGIIFDGITFNLITIGSLGEKSALKIPALQILKQTNINKIQLIPNGKFIDLLSRLFVSING